MNSILNSVLSITIYVYGENLGRVTNLTTLLPLLSQEMCRCAFGACYPVMDAVRLYGLLVL